MKLWTSALLIICIAVFSFAQDSTRTGFAIVTVLSGNIAGLVATENLINTNGGTEQTVVAPSILITQASILVTLGPISENTTAIAIANPSLGTGGVNLVLNDATGGVVGNTTMVIGPRGQISRYLNEIFTLQSAPQATPLLLTISSELPVAVLALNFRNGSFSPIPLTSLSFPTPVPVQTLTPVPLTVPATTVLVNPALTTATIPVPPTSAVNPGFGLGVAGTLPFNPPVSNVFVTRSPVTTAVTNTPTIGGGSSFTFAQIALGGGWSSEIALGNTSTTPQTVRIDFFRSDGVVTSSMENIVIPSRGVFFISSDISATAIQ